MSLETIIDELIGREGKYSNRPTDRGGETMWGVTVAQARAHGYKGLMKDMPRSVAVEIYKYTYWYAPKFDKIFVLAPAVAEELLDTGVNMGTRIAAEFLQRALNVLRRPTEKLALYKKLLVDGELGPATRNALEAYIKHRGGAGVEVLLTILDSLQCARYVHIAEADESQLDYTYGWVRARCRAAGC